MPLTFFLFSNVIFYKMKAVVSKQKYNNITYIIASLGQMNATTKYNKVTHTNTKNWSPTIFEYGHQIPILFWRSFYCSHQIVLVWLWVIIVIVIIIMIATIIFSKTFVRCVVFATIYLYNITCMAWLLCAHWQNGRSLERRKGVRINSL